jgi:hypothetical protein
MTARWDRRHRAQLCRSIATPFVAADRKDQGLRPDARTRRDRHHRRMDGFTPVNVTLHIVSPEPLRGTLSEPDQPDRAFIGWTAFATLMDAIIRRHGEVTTSA